MTVGRRVVSGAKAALLGRAVYSLTSAILLVALTRYLLDPASYGRLYLALSVLGIAKLASGLGLAKAGARYVTEYLETDPAQVPLILRRTLAFALLTAALAAAALYLGRYRVAALVDGPALAPFLLVGVWYILLAPVATYPRTMFQAFNRVSDSALLRAVEGVARLTIAVALVVAGLGALGALAGYVAAFAVSGLLGLYLLYTRCYTALVPAIDADPGLTRRLLSYAVPVTVTRGADVLDSKVDTVLVGALLTGTTGVAFYTLARQIAVFVSMPAQSLGYSLSPALGEQKAGADVREAGRLYEQSMAYVLLVYVPGAAGLFLVAEPLVRYGIHTDYLGAVPILKVLCLFVVVFAVNTATSNSLDYLGRAGTRAKARGVTAICNFGLNLALIPPLGAVGAAAATVLTYTTYTLVNVYTIHQELSLRTAWLARRLGLVAAVAAGTVAPVIATRHVIDGLPALAGVVALGGATWATLAVLTGLIEPRQAMSELA